jgi:chemotaxis protein CheD
MNHFALPSAEYAHSSELSRGNPLRYGDQATQQLIEQVCKQTGSPASALKAKVVGGASVVDELKQSSAIGLLNVEMARAVLQKVGIPIVNEAVGGDSGRKVYFYTETGRLRVSSLK